MSAAAHADENPVMEGPDRGSGWRERLFAGVLAFVLTGGSTLVVLYGAAWFFMTMGMYGTPGMGDVPAVPEALTRAILWVALIGALIAGFATAGSSRDHSTPPRPGGSEQKASRSDSSA